MSDSNESELKFFALLNTFDHSIRMRALLEVGAL